jgi:hypothetical protein
MNFCYKKGGFGKKYHIKFTQHCEFNRGENKEEIE